MIFIKELEIGDVAWPSKTGLLIFLLHERLDWMVGYYF